MTGRYDKGFNPKIGLNREAFDIGWGFTYTDNLTMLEFSGIEGFMFDGRNDETDYKTGDEFQFEWGSAGS